MSARRLLPTGLVLGYRAAPRLPPNAPAGAVLAAAAAYYALRGR